MTKKNSLFKVACVTTALSMVLVGCGDKKKSDETNSDAPAANKELINQVSDEEIPEYKSYNLIWHDEFNGDKLDDTIWSYDPHEPGWTNEELQEYTESTDNVFVKDGNLVLKAIETEQEDGSKYYTSGKIKSQNKKDFMYGKVEVRAKVPEGQGLWPAIWMMPTDESFYGQWPKCGEIDIMEVLGSDTNISYSTIHYGEPHAEQQGTISLKGGAKFSDDYHVFTVIWEPGQMKFLTDDELVLTVNDWFTAVEGEDEKAYPAPFNQTFFMQLNLAVGGTWPGNPDATTDFDNAEFLIDYVRVYQKDEYDTNVSKPEKQYREATEDGNLIWNGDFAEEEALDDEENWYFLTFEGGDGSAKIENGELVVTSTAAGSVDYSVQIVQPELPMLKGHKYHISFDAKASEDRTAITCISAPTAGWVRYLEDTKIDVTTDWTTYEFDIEMTEKDDNNGRFEFNMGNQGSTAELRFRNIRVEDVTN